MPIANSAHRARNALSGRDEVVLGPMLGETHPATREVRCELPLANDMPRPVSVTRLVARSGPRQKRNQDQTSRSPQV